MKMITPNDEMLNDMIEEAKKLGKPEVTDMGWMTFDYWMKTQYIIQKFVLIFTAPGIEERSKVRRAYLKE